MDSENENLHSDKDKYITEKHRIVIRNRVLDIKKVVNKLFR